MNSLLRSLFALDDKPRHPAVPDGYRIYAVGDVHGRDDLLDDLLGQIEEDIACARPAKIVIVFLGDLIDRGPASAEVIERLRTYAGGGHRLIFLAGNHEEVLLRILDGDEQLVVDWLGFGGAECMRSYGVDPKRLKRMTAAEAAEAIRNAIPLEHADFLRGFDDTFRAGDYLFVHAGIRPGVPIEQQSQTDLRWIREPFLTHGGDHGFVVVHGHSISEQVDEKPNRICVDTGAYRTGTLSALVLENGERRYLRTKQP